MNEHTQKLLEQATYYILGVRLVDQKKFAELIVKECANVFWSEDCNTSDLALEEYTRNSKKIKQHFGVEE